VEISNSFIYKFLFIPQKDSNIFKHAGGEALRYGGRSPILDFALRYKIWRGAKPFLALSY